MNLLEISNPEAAMQGQSHNPTSLHVVHAVLSLDLGGLERLVLDLVKAGRQCGTQSSVICIESRGQLAESAEKLGATVYCLSKPPGRSRVAVTQATELLAKLKPDVVHTHQIGALWYVGQAAMKAGMFAVVHTEHSDHVKQAVGVKNKLRKFWMWRSCQQWASTFCCVSEDIARSVRRLGAVPSDKVAVVLNGIDTSLYPASGVRNSLRHTLRIPADARVIGTVGRLSEVKQQDLLLRGFSQLATRHQDLILLLVGDGAERQRLEVLASELGVSGRTVFAGYQAHPEQFYSVMDVFALTSRHEGLPLSLLEAWASGLPVVSSAVGGIPKVVVHEKSGLLFASGDDVELVNSLERIITNQKLAANLAKSGQATVRDKYSLLRMADDYERYYRSALHNVKQDNR